MARNQNTESEVPVTDTVVTEAVATESAAVDGAAPAVVEANAPDERFIMIKHDKTGEMVKRKDFIVECWVERKMERGAIAKLLSEIQGKKVPYQIVFAATKKIAGGPDKTAAPAEGEAAGEAAPETPADTQIGG